MTVNALLKILQRQVAKGNGRNPVAVDKGSLWDGNGTFNICGVRSAERIQVNIVDGDGFHIDNKDGSERSEMTFVLYGPHK